MLVKFYLLSQLVFDCVYLVWTSKVFGYCCFLLVLSVVLRCDFKYWESGISSAIKCVTGSLVGRFVYVANLLKGHCFTQCHRV